MTSAPCSCIVHGMRWVVLSGVVFLTGCALVSERQFAEAVGRFQAEPEFRAKAVGAQVWVTETTVWQDAAGFDRTVSCTAIRPLEWFTARGYRMIPTAQEAARDGLVIAKKTYSPVTATVEVGPQKAPPDAIYRFYRGDGGWELSGVEVFSRLASPNGRPPEHRCVATE